MMDKEQLQAAVDSHHWYHRIELPHGIVTPGVLPAYPENYKLPLDLTGKRVLDIGAYDGYWTFECLKRGAAHVHAVDNFTDTIHEGERRSWAQLRLCAEALGYQDRILCEEKDLLSMFGAGRRYDVILFLGALYHVRHPLLALDIIYDLLKPGGLLMVESHISDDWSPYNIGHQGNGDSMVMEFYPDAQLAENPTNWWGPTMRVIGCMLRTAGFINVTIWKIDKPGHLRDCRGYAHAWKV